MEPRAPKRIQEQEEICRFNAPYACLSLITKLSRQEAVRIMNPVLPENSPKGDRVKPTLSERAFAQFKEVFGMFLYLWVLFALFTYHKAVVLAQHDIPFEPFGVAIFNAFVLAKVMLVVEKMNLAERVRGKPLVFPILHKSIVLSLTFILFNLTEKIVVGLWKGKSLTESLPTVGNGSPIEVIVTASILAVALIPFFAFRELSRALGGGVLGSLLMKGAKQGGILRGNADEPPTSH